MKIRRVLYITGLCFIVIGVLAALPWIQPPLFRQLTKLMGRYPSSTAGIKLQIGGLILVVTGLLLVLTGHSWLSVVKLWLQSVSHGYHRIEAGLTRWLEKYVTLTGVSAPPQEQAPLKTKQIALWDWAAAASFLLFALFYFIGRLQDNFPFVDLGGDAANIASFAAAWAHPEYFRGDALLGNLDNIRIYATIHIPLLQWLKGITGNYGLAMVSTLAPHIFIQMLGFYIFGRVVFKNRYWAFLLAVATTMPFIMNLGERWGIMQEPVPRFTFQAVLPYLLTLAWVWRKQPRRWPWVMAVTGAMVYLHPVSTPAWALAIWLAMWLFIPVSWLWLKRLGFMFANGLIIALVAAPFILNYTGHHVQGQSLSYELVYYIVDTFFPPNLINIPAAVGEFLLLTLVSGLLPLSIVAFFLLRILKRDDGDGLRLILGWMAGLALMSVIFPWIEHTIERYLRMVPYETELARGLRYFVPLMLLFCLWTLSELQRHWKNPARARSVALLGACLVGLWVITNLPDPQLFQKAAACLAKGQLVCSSLTDMDQALVAIKEMVPPGSPIFSSSSMFGDDTYSLGVRYNAERPLVFSYKDRGLLTYSNAQALNQWHEIYKQMEYFKSNPRRALKIQTIMDLRKQYSFDYLLLDFAPGPNNLKLMGGQDIYHNKTYYLVKLGQ
jgi:hypothetical protein